MERLGEVGREVELLRRATSTGRDEGEREEKAVAVRYPVVAGHEGERAAELGPLGVAVDVGPRLEVVRPEAPQVRLGVLGGRLEQVGDRQAARPNIPAPHLPELVRLRCPRRVRGRAERLDDLGARVLPPNADRQEGEQRVEQVEEAHVLHQGLLVGGYHELAEARRRPRPLEDEGDDARPDQRVAERGARSPVLLSEVHVRFAVGRGGAEEGQVAGGVEELPVAVEDLLVLAAADAAAPEQGRLDGELGA
jgi:hypothetical protein